MKVTSSKDIPPPPPRMPVTFHLELSEVETLALSELLGCVGGSYAGLRSEILEPMLLTLQGEIRRQQLVDHHAGGYPYYDAYVKSSIDAGIVVPPPRSLYLGGQLGNGS